MTREINKSEGEAKANGSHCFRFRANADTRIRPSPRRAPRPRPGPGWSPEETTRARRVTRRSRFRTGWDSSRLPPRDGSFRVHRLARRCWDEGGGPVQGEYPARSGGRRAAGPAGRRGPRARDGDGRLPQRLAHHQRRLDPAPAHGARARGRRRRRRGRARRLERAPRRPHHLLVPPALRPLLLLLERTLHPLRWVRLCALRHARRDAPPAPQRAGHQPDGARLAGARTIIACDLLENKLAFAREFGATDTWNAKEGDVAERVRKLTGGRGADYAFDAIGSEATTLQILDAIRPGGLAVIVGM